MADSMENFQLFHVTETLAQLVQLMKELKEENQFIKAQLTEKFGPTTVVSKGKNPSLSMVMGLEELIVNLSRQMAALTEEVHQMKQQMQTWYCQSQSSKHFADKNTKVQGIVTRNSISQHQQDFIGPLILEYDQEPPSETTKREFTDLPISRPDALKWLLKERMITLLESEPVPNPLPSPGTFQMKEFCDYHLRHGHATDKCLSLKYDIQDLIDMGLLDPQNLLSSGEASSFPDDHKPWFEQMKRKSHDNHDQQCIVMSPVSIGQEIKVATIHGVYNRGNFTSKKIKELQNPMVFKYNQLTATPKQALKKEFTPLPFPPSVILQQGLASGHITLPGIRAPPNPLPANWRMDQYCEYHRGPGHLTDNCIALKFRIQKLIDEKKISLPESCSTAASRSQCLDN
ncbi:uncharacterized protein LOC143880324 [Tasmannia lanceolata]|uniref:uncharacterized protein LOC143880324 n=1 Tax=Tasmannia lanceolata TaxID=3420 RepID=UPI004063AB75